MVQHQPLQLQHQRHHQATTFCLLKELRKTTTRGFKRSDKTLASSEEALIDFAQIQTQDDIARFNQEI